LRKPLKRFGIKTTKAEIEKLGAQIKELEVKIQKRDEALKTRVRSVQESGGVVSYLDVLLGAKSFGNFLDRVNAVTVIVQQDKDILQAHVNDQQMLEQLKSEEQAQLTGLEQKRKELKSDQQTLLSQKGQKEELMAELKEKEQQVEEELLDLAEQDEILRKQEASYKRLLAQWQEQQRRIEEAKKRGEKPPISDGSFSRPANGPVTSNYGSRWGKLHAGIDIGKRGSDVPIVAAADGIVFRS
jgi:peptidoglycan hydrolase CwlO-like protein